MIDPSATRTWTHALARPRRALYISSPIGLGHAQRDVAIADALRALHPDLEIDWLAQHPVTAVLEEHGERVHPMSSELASESAHITAESSEHDLNAFQAIRRMDEILLSNFMVFHDTVEAGEYDVVIGDEAWDIDHYLHENPELKRTAFAWMTDFVGWLPMPAGGEREAYLTADYNAEMIEHVERFRGSGTGPSSWAIPTISCPMTSARACRRSANGPSATTRSAATSPGSTPHRSSSDARSFARSWAITPTNGWSSSRSGARASARRCFAA